ncbi:MAG: ABC transporter substrate-binding protein [Gemmatimonadota bacterium]
MPGLRALAVALALGFLAAACAPRAESHTLNYYFSYDPRSLDPALSTDVPTGEVVTLLFDNLTQFDAAGQLVPGLARTWETDSTGRRWTFHLVRGARFHDGRALTAEDVRASYLRALRPGASGGRAWPLYPIAGARAYADGRAREVPGIRVVNDTVVEFTLEEPLNIFPKLLAMPVAAIVPTPTPQGFDQQPVGSGPWRFVSWAHDDEILLVRNPDYWGGPPEADSLRIRIIPEPLTQAAEYEAGHLSVVEIPFGETLRWQQTHEPELQRRPSLRAMYVALNTTRGPLRDVRVRQAINHAVNVPVILRTMMGDRGVPAAGAVPPGLAGHDSSRPRYRFDPAKARRLLAQAGYPDGIDLKLWRSQRPEYARVAQAVQRYLGDVGIRVEIIERDASSARAAARKGEADMFLTDWYADYPDAENFTYPLFHSKNHGPGGNLAFLSDPTLDALIERARQTMDEAEKVALIRTIDRRVFDLAPWLFCWFPVDLWAMRPGVTGWSIPAIFTGQRWTRVRHTS